MLPEKLMTAIEDIQIPALRYFDSISSSNDEALSWAQSGASDGALVIADQQTKGRGRFGRSWITNPGTALAFSMVIIPTQSEAEHFALFSPLGALAVCLALEKNYGLNPEIKWPNDVLINQHKVCGVLAEAAWDGQKLLSVVLGIGINVAHNALPPVNQLRFPATSIETVFGQPVDRWELLKYILEEIQIWRKEMGTDRFLQTWQERLAYRGQPVFIKNTGGKTLSGKLLGIDAQGNLRLLNNNKEEIQISAGDVSLHPGNHLGNTQRGE